MEGHSGTVRSRSSQSPSPSHSASASASSSVHKRKFQPTTAATAAAVAPFSLSDAGALTFNGDLDSISAREEEEDTEDEEDDDDEDEDDEEDNDSMRAFTAARLDPHSNAGGGGSSRSNNKPPEPDGSSVKVETASACVAAEGGGKEERGAAGSSAQQNAASAGLIPWILVKDDAVKGIFTENIQTSGAYSAREEGLKREMASGFGDQSPRRGFMHTFRSRKSRATSGGVTPTTTPPAITSATSTATTPHTPAAATTHTPATVTTSTHVYHSPDPHIPPGYPYTAFPAPPSTYPYPPHAYYLPQPYYSTFPPYPATQPDAPPPAVPPPAVGSSQDTRQYIEPEGDTFNPPKQATHKIRDLIRGNFEAPYLSWKKIPLGVRDMWFREFQRDFYWQPQYADRIRRNFEHRGSVRMRDMFTDIRKSGERPHWIGERVWGDLCASWESPAYAKKREQNKQNRASDCGGAGTSLHTGGARPHTEYRRQLVASLGREPTMSELHTRTHQRRDTQEWVDARAQQVNEEYARLREQQSQMSVGEGSSGASSYPPTDFDLWTQAVGGKKKGRTYGLGSQGPAFDTQSTYTSPSDYTGWTVHDMMLAQEKIHQDMQQQQRQMQDQMLQYQQQIQEQQQHQQQMQQQMQEMLRLIQQHMPPPPQPPQPPQQGDDDDDE